MAGKLEAGLLAEKAPEGKAAAASAEPVAQQERISGRLLADSRWVTHTQEVITALESTMPSTGHHRP